MNNTYTENLITKVLSRDKNHIYNFFNTQSKQALFSRNLELVYDAGKFHENSLQFIANKFKYLFDDHSKEFMSKYQQATGSGLESRRIHRIHSSSLIAFLTFYNVSSINTLQIKNHPVLKDIKFQESIFEYGNDISDSSHNSKIDVTLFDGKNINQSKNILFLESKFDEYVDQCHKEYKISNKYKALFKTEVIEKYLKKYNLVLNNDTKAPDHYVLEKKSGKTNIYCGGIKQMLCHYLGTINYANSHKDQKVYLGTVLFDFGNKVKKAEKKLESYKNLYQDLAVCLNQLSNNCDTKYHKPSNLIILEKIITYKQIYDLDFNFNKNAKIMYVDEK